jgi:hypothetical protein
MELFGQTRYLHNEFEKKFIRTTVRWSGQWTSWANAARQWLWTTDTQQLTGDQATEQTGQIHQDINELGQQTKGQLPSDQDMNLVGQIPQDNECGQQAQVQLLGDQDTETTGQTWSNVMFIDNRLMKNPQNKLLPHWWFQ